jgi:hypothetical protein
MLFVGYIGCVKNSTVVYTIVQVDYWKINRSTIKSKVRSNKDLLQRCGASPKRNYNKKDFVLTRYSNGLNAPYVKPPKYFKQMHGNLTRE